MSAFVVGEYMGFPAQRHGVVAFVLPRLFQERTDEFWRVKESMKVSLFFPVEEILAQVRGNGAAEKGFSQTAIVQNRFGPFVVAGQLFEDAQTQRLMGIATKGSEHARKEPPTQADGTENQLHLST